MDSRQRLRRLVRESESLREKEGTRHMDFLVWLENSALGTWVRESTSVWAYSGLISFHAFGLAFVVGLSWMIALRVLGFAPSLPLAPMEKLFPAIWIAFWVNAVSGIALARIIHE